MSQSALIVLSVILDAILGAMPGIASKAAIVAERRPR